MLTRTEFNLIGDILARSGLFQDRRAQWQLGLSFTCLLVAQASIVLVPLIFGRIIDALTLGSSALIFLLLAGFTIARFTNRFAANLKEFLFDWATFSLLVRLYSSAFSHLLSLPYSFYVEGSSGSVTKAWDRGAWASQEVIDALIYRFFPMSLTATFTLGVVLWLYGLLMTLVVFICMVVYVIWVQWSVQRVRKHMRRTNAFEDNLTRIAVDSFTNALSVKVFNGYRSSEERIAADFAGYRDENRQVSLASLILGSGGAIIVSLALSIVMCLAYLQFRNGDITTGQFVALFTLVNQVFMPISGIGRAYRDIKAALIKWDTLQNMLKLETEFDQDGDLQAEIKNQSIRFDKVGFSYGDKTVLKDLSFDIKPGQSPGIVGPSGSGKSTIVKLLLGLWKPETGSICLVDDQKAEVTDLNAFDLKSWRGHFGVVTQDPALLNDTIRNNIQFGRRFKSEEQTAAELERAAKAAELTRFVDDLPQGYDTLIGERGVKLSGGEAQRVALARALVGDPKILVFDEATSSLDTAVERDIQDNLNRVSKGRTTVLIAHRLTTIQDADVILVIDQGRLVERGNHEELLAQKGLYHSLWNVQSKTE